VVIEHSLDVVKCADWIVDLGPEGGERGGTVVACGTPEDVARDPASHTGRYLKPILGRAAVSGGPAPARKPRRGSGRALA
jgi:excinuclease ABC subunit A